jgi:hypothetical protein
MRIEVEEIGDHRWTLRFHGEEVKRLVAQLSPDDLEEAFGTIAAMKLGVYESYIDYQFEDYQSGTYVMMVEAKEGFEEAKAAFERESRRKAST